MAKATPAKKKGRTRGAVPKISLVLTGIGTFAALILALASFIGAVAFPDRIESVLNANSSTSYIVILLALFGYSLDEILRFAALALLISGVWCLIFWLICLKSRTHRVRDVICTIFGRIPVIILAIVILIIYMDFPLHMLFVLTVVAIIWAILMILLSAVGWRKT